MSLTIMAAAKEVTALQNPKMGILQKQFLPVRCAAQEVTQELFYLSFCGIHESNPCGAERNRCDRSCSGM